MATLSRSSRRPEDNALHHHHHIVGRPTATHHLMATSAARANTAAAALATQNQNILSRGASGRVKRALDATDCDPDDKVITKRSRITVDIPARVVNTGGTVGGSGGTGGSGGNDGPAGSGDLAGSGTVLQKGAPPSQRARGQKQQAVQQAGPPAAADHCKVDPPTENKARHASGTRPPDKRRRIDASKTDNPDKLTKSQEKVRNGIQHELDRLQPASADAKPEGRKLRSQETIRFKSELSTYFPEYDEVIGNDPKQSRKHLECRELRLFPKLRAAVSWCLVTNLGAALNRSPKSRNSNHHSRVRTSSTRNVRDRQDKRPEAACQRTSLKRYRLLDR